MTVVLQIILSNTIKNAGKTVSTVTMLMIAPLAIKLHKEPIISIFEYIPTPNVAPKKHNALTIIDWIDVSKASSIAWCLSFPSILAVLYFVVIKIA